MVERRYLLGGIDSDTAYQNIEKDAMLNAVNVRTVVSRTQHSTNVRFIAGNTEMDNFYEALVYSAYQPHTPPAAYPNGLEPRYVEKGRCVDGDDIYFFLQDYNPTPNVAPFTYTVGMTTYAIPHESKIVKYNILTKEATLLLSEYWVDANLTDEWGLLTNNFLDCGVSDGKLFWVDTIPRYLDLSIDYKAEYTTGDLPNYANGYTNTFVPFSADILSLVTEPSVVPLMVTPQTDPNVSSIFVQQNGLQFCVRFTNQSGFYSVLSPYSLTNLPVTEADIIANGFDYNNTVDITLPLSQKIPLNWKKVEYIVRDIQTGGFYVIKVWDRNNTTQKAEVDAHNSGTSLTFEGYFGNNLYAIGATDIAKQFDSVPLSATSMALVANRLLFGDIVEGYSTPVVDVPYTVVDNTVSFSPISSTTKNSYMIACKEDGVDKWWVGIVYFDGTSKVYGMDYDYGRCTLNTDAIDTTNPMTISIINNDLLWEMPTYIHSDYLNYIDISQYSDADIVMAFNTTGQSHDAANPTKATLIRTDIIKAIFNDASLNVSLNHHYQYLLHYNDFELITDKNSYFDNSSDTKAFLGGASYKVGIDYYDQALRKCGRQDLDPIDIAPYSPYSTEITKSIDFTLSNTFVTNPIPDWAYYYGVTMSPQQKSKSIIQFIPNIIKSAFLDSNGKMNYYGWNEVYLNGLSGLTIGMTYYGIAIPIASVSRYGYGYDYKSGDFVEIQSVLKSGGAITNSFFLRGYVKSVQDGYVVMSPFNDALPYLQPIVSFASNKIKTSNQTNTSTAAAELVVSQPYCMQYINIVTIYKSLPDTEQYEIAKFGNIANPTKNSRQYGNFFDSGTLTATIDGDFYAQARTASTGGFPCMSNMTNESIPHQLNNNLGRVALLDTIGQKSLPTAIRWSNTFIPSAQTNGYASFDALDIKVLEPTADQIVRLIPTTKGTTEGSQLLVLCTGGSFVTLVGKAQLFGADQQQAAISATNAVLGEVNPLTGNWTCNSPKSAVTYQGLTFWADSQNRDIIQFGANGATPVSSMAKGSRLFRDLFTQYDWGTGAIIGSNASGGAITSVSILDGGFGYRTGTYTGVKLSGGTTHATITVIVGADGIINGIELENGGAGYPNGSHSYTTLSIDKEYYLNIIKGAVNPYTNEYMITFPAADPTPIQPTLITTAIKNPFNCYSALNSTYIYNWNLNKWVSVYEDAGAMFNLGDDVYSTTYAGVNGYPDQWVNRLYKQFSGTAGNYYGTVHDAMICLPFNEGYPTVKAPLAIIGDMTRYPDEVWIEADGMKKLNSSTIGVANTQVWFMREGDAMANVLRDRRSLGDDDTKYAQAGVKGNRLKGKTVNVCLIWYGVNGAFQCSSVGLRSEVASGHS